MSERVSERASERASEWFATNVTLNQDHLPRGNNNQVFLDPLGNRVQEDDNNWVHDDHERRRYPDTSEEERVGGLVLVERCPDGGGDLLPDFEQLIQIQRDVVKPPTVVGQRRLQLVQFSGGIRPDLFAHLPYADRGFGILVEFLLEYLLGDLNETDARLVCLNSAVLGLMGIQVYPDL